MSTDPQWEAFKLRIVRCQSFRCKSCRAPVGTAQVRHAYTVSGRPLWDYPDHALYVSCDKCQAKLEKLQRILALNTFSSNSRVETLVAISGLLNPQLDNANGFLSWVPGGLAAVVEAKHRFLSAGDPDVKEEALSDFKEAVDELCSALHQDLRQMEVRDGNPVRPCRDNASPSAR